MIYLYVYQTQRQICNKMIKYVHFSYIVLIIRVGFSSIGITYHVPFHTQP